MRETICEITGRTIGYIEENGNRRVAKDICGRILGYYDGSTGYTTDVAGRRLFKGDCCSALILAHAGYRLDI